MEQPALRIGELGRRTGVSPALLRAWERRYGLLEPARTPGGLRLYSPADERRVREMQGGLSRGLSAAEAARAALEAPAEAGPAPSPRLAEALSRMDAGSAHSALDQHFATFTLETVLADVVLPYLHDLGERWSRGEASVAQEHFASNLIRGRLLSLARGWEAGDGPAALLACAPGEQHDLGLIVFGLALRARGWRIAYLGADTPVASAAEAARLTRAALVVISAVAPARFEDVADELAELAGTQPLSIAGAGAHAELAARLGAQWLAGDPVGAAAGVSARAAA